MQEKIKKKKEIYKLFLKKKDKIAFYYLDSNLLLTMVSWIHLLVPWTLSYLDFKN